MTTEELRASVLAFTQRPLAPIAALEEEQAVRLIEPGTGKELRVRWDDIAQVELKSTPLRTAPYLLVVLQDGRQVALADVGFAFAPSIVNTGPLPDLPPTMCFRDFRHLSAGVEQLFEEEGREREILGAILLCIALLDVARTIGFDVSREERTLDALLKRLEARGIKL